MARLVRRKCPCLRPKMEEEVKVLDYRHSSLTDVPSEVFNYERTLEELHADSNQIRDLPRELFFCHGLRKLSISDNEITSIPPAIASLDHLEELDFSKNGIIDVPDNVKCCKYLRIVDASVNPLGKLPEGFTQLQNLTHLYMNDTFLDYLPGSFGRLVKLKILEMRENHLKTLPKSFGRLTELERLDIGNNEFTELPDVVGSLTKLLELWCDNNQITSFTHALGCLKQLIFLDASKNELSSLPGEIEGCTSLADLHLTSNHLHTLPEAIGHLSSLTTLKVDDNELTSLPSTLGGLTSLSELNVSANDLEDLPTSIGLLRNLRTFYADENLLAFVPAELGSCSGITVLSLRGNRLTYIPDELGRIPRLRVLNLSDNLLSYLPFTIVKLKELQALWLTENQTRPLIPLQSDYEADTGRKILTCYLLPQGQQVISDDAAGDGDTDSFHPSIWDEERQQRQQIHFSFDDNDEDEGHLVRCPTPYPKEMREKARHMRNLALRQSTSDSTQPPSRSPQSHQTSQGGGGVEEDTMGGGGRAEMESSRGSKAHSPSLQQETHRLYSCDKEKLMRDKARMQHRHSMTGDGAPFASSTPKRGDSTSGASDIDEDGRVAGRRKSTPNLLSFEGGQSPDSKQPRRMPSFTYEDLYHKQILRKHHHHHGGRRTRRMRDYDSDTGCRSDREVSFTRRGGDKDADGRGWQSDGEGMHHHPRHQNHHHRGDVKDDDMSVRSQPVMSRAQLIRRAGPPHSSKDGGSASDFEAYAAGRGRGSRRGGNHRGSRSNNVPATTTPSPMPRQSQQPSPIAHQSPMTPHQQQPQSLAHHQRHDVQSPAVVSGQDPGLRPVPGHSRPQSCLTVPGSQQPGPSTQSPSPSPIPLNDSAALDDSTAQAQQELSSSGSSVFAQSMADSRDRTLQAELHSVLEEHNKKMAALTLRHQHTPSPSGSGGRQASGVRQTPPPPPYHPAPPYRRPSDRDSDSSGIPRSPHDSDLGNSSFSNPPEHSTAGGSGTCSKEAAEAALAQRQHHHQQQKQQQQQYQSQQHLHHHQQQQHYQQQQQQQQQYNTGPMTGHDRTNMVRSSADTGQTQGVVGMGQAQTVASRLHDHHHHSGGMGGRVRYDSPSAVGDGRQLNNNNNSAADVSQNLSSSYHQGRHRYDSPSSGHHQSTVNSAVQLASQAVPTQFCDSVGRGGGSSGSRSRYDSPCSSQSSSKDLDGARSSPYADGRAVVDNRTRYDSPSTGLVSAGAGVSAHQGGNYGTGARTRYAGFSGDQGPPHGDGGPSGVLDYSVTSPYSSNPRRGSSGQYTMQAPSQFSVRRASAPYPGRPQGSPLSHFLPHNPNLDTAPRLSPQLYGTPPSVRPRTGSRDDPGLAAPCEPRVVRRSPKPMDSRASPSPTKPCPSTVPPSFENSPQRYSNSSPYSSSSPKPYSSSTQHPSSDHHPHSSSQRAFEACGPSRGYEAYPGAYGEPLEVGDPLMKGCSEDQGSNSSDSGYVHGNQLCERLGADYGLNARRSVSGSPYSTPSSQRGTPVRQNSSSQGTPSRETTPVREREDAVFYSLQPGGPSAHGHDYPAVQEERDVFRTVIRKNPGLGFSIAGGNGSHSQNPFRPGESGIFVTKVHAEGPAASSIQPGDKLLKVNHVDFSNIDHSRAVNVLKTCSTVDLLVERVQRINLV